jgi:hypothetical protein
MGTRAGRRQLDLGDSRQDAIYDKPQGVGLAPLGICKQLVDDLLGARLTLGLLGEERIELLLGLAPVGVLVDALGVAGLAGLPGRQVLRVPAGGHYRSTSREWPSGAEAPVLSWDRLFKLYLGPLGVVALGGPLLTG